MRFSFAIVAFLGLATALPTVPFDIDTSGLIETRHHQGKKTGGKETKGAAAAAAAASTAANTTACAKSIDSDLETRHHQGKKTGANANTNAGSAGCKAAATRSVDFFDLSRLVKTRLP